MFKDWIVHCPARRENGDAQEIVKVFHSKSKYKTGQIYCRLSIGKKVLEKCKLKVGDKVVFKINPENANEFLLEKAVNVKGYTISKQNTSSNYFLICCRTWLPESELDASDFKIRVVNHSIQGNRIIINLAKGNV